MAFVSALRGKCSSQWHMEGTAVTATHINSKLYYAYAKSHLILFCGWCKCCYCFQCASTTASSDVYYYDDEANKQHKQKLQWCIIMQLSPLHKWIKNYFCFWFCFCYWFQCSRRVVVQHYSTLYIMLLKFNFSIIIIISLLVH